MDFPGGSASQSELRQIKVNLKKWEHEFRKQHSRAPSKADVQACASIQQLYKQYATLKAKLGKENLEKENLGKENQCKDDKIHLKSEPRDFRTNKGINVELFPLERSRLWPSQPASPSDDSSGSHISSTPPKSLPEKCTPLPFRIRKPLESISLNQRNETLLNSDRRSSTVNLEPGKSVEKKTADKVAEVAPKKAFPNAALGNPFASAAPQQKDIPAAPLALEGGLIIRLHRQGVQLNDRRSNLSDDPLPAGFFASCRPSSLIRKDPESFSITPAEDSTLKDGDFANPSPVKTFVTSSDDNNKNRGIIGDIAQRGGFVVDGFAGAETVARTLPPSGDFGIERLSNLVSADHCNPAASEGNETRTTSSLEKQYVEKKGLLQKTSVILVKRMLLKHGLPLTGNKSTLITRLEEALLTERNAGQASAAVDIGMKFNGHRQIYDEITLDAKVTKSLKRKASKSPEEEEEQEIVSQPCEDRRALSSMTVVVLKQMLLKRGLPLTGNKSSLISRLEGAVCTQETGKSGADEDADVKHSDPRQTNEKATHFNCTNTSSRKDVEGPEEPDERNVIGLVEDMPTRQSLGSISAGGNVVTRITRSMLNARTTDDVVADSFEQGLDSCLDSSHSSYQGSEQLQRDTSKAGRKPLKPTKKSSVKSIRASCSKHHATENMTSTAPSLAPLTPAKSQPNFSAGETQKVAPLVNANTKRVKISEPLENSWANPSVLRKRARRQKGSSSIPNKSRQRLCVRPGERDNFVKLNLNGKGKRRKFVNGTRTRRPGAYGRRGCTYEAKLRKWDRGGTAHEGLAHEGHETHKEVGSEPGRTYGLTGRRTDSLWPDDGWLGTSTSPEDLDDSKCNNVDELTVPSEDILEVPNCPSDKRLFEVLRSVFGFKTFQTGQLEAIKRVLSLQSTMVILPTGAGKSLCYQLPAYLLPGISLVISPLKALMNDQLRRLPLSLPGAVICSGQTPVESSATIARLRAGEVKVLFISPERLFSESFFRTLGELPKISLAVVDEAHCLSEWSHNFRPSYFRLGKVLHQRMKVPCVVAMTATATKKAEHSILKSLSIPNDGVVQASHVRHNLLLKVSRETNRLQSLLSMLQKSPYKEAKSIIIYCKFQVETDNLSGFLQQNGIQSKAYHAKKTNQERDRIYHLFCSNKLRVVVATIAFGMGIDKSDVRAIVHYNMPQSLEHYVQETGRAGRDGNPAYCHLFLDDGDYFKLRSLAYSDGVDEYSVGKFLSRVFEGSSSSRPRDLVSIAIEVSSIELDMKEEVMETVLSYLEVGEVEYVKVLSKLNATCTLSFHKTNIASLSGRNPLVAAIVKRSKVTHGRYVFDIPSLATQLHWSLFNVQSALRKLQSAGEITYDLGDSALCFTVLRVPVDICLLTSEIITRLTEVEQCQVRKIDAMYLAASTSVQNMNGPGPPESNVSSCQQASLQTRIKSYFEEEEGSPVSQNFPAIIKSDSSFVQADIKVFLKSCRNPNMTGRAVARIFHGLWSPAFPYSEWANNHFWGQHSRVDFLVIKQAAAAQILTQHATNRNHFQL